MGAVTAVAMHQLPYRLDDEPFPPHETPDNSARNYVFSIVRDPLVAARSGYLEVSRRAMGWADATNDSRRAAYVAIPCERAAERFERFLTSVAALPRM